MIAKRTTRSPVFVTVTVLAALYVTFDNGANHGAANGKENGFMLARRGNR